MTAYRIHGRKFLVTAAAAGLLALPTTAASAQPPAERGQGQERAEQQVTEDDDTNDGGTPEDVADDGDDAHPSGRDRSVEPGGNPNKGNAQHDPDGDTNGGVDQPGGDGGEDLADQDGNNGCGNDDDFEDDNNGNCGGSERGAEMRAAAADRRAERDRTDHAGSAFLLGTTSSTSPSTNEQTTETAAASAATSGTTTTTEDASGTGEVAVLGVSYEQLGTGSSPILGGPVEVLGVAYTRPEDTAATGEATLAGGDVTGTEVLGVAFAADALPRTGAGAAGLLAMGLTTLAGGSALLRRRR